MQAFAYTHINPAKSFLARVTGRYNLIQFQKIKDNKVVLPPDKPIQITARLVSGYIPPGMDVQLSVIDKPDWLKVVSAPVSKTRMVKYKVKVRGKGKNKNKVTVQTQTRLEVPPMKITLQGTENAAGKVANIVMEASWVVTPKPDSRGRVRKYTQKITLPALQIQGGGN